MLATTAGAQTAAPAATAAAPTTGGEAGQAGGEEAGGAGLQAGARAEGDGSAQGDERQARGGQVDVVHGDRRLRVSEQARAADRLHDALRRDDAAAGQAQGPDARRRPRFRVLLRRQDDDGVRAGRESGRGRRRATDDRRGADDGLQHGRHLLSVHRPAGDRSLCGDDRWRDPRVLHRPVGGGRRREDGHGGVGQQGRVPADLDRRRRQAAASGPGDLRRRPGCSCATSSSFRTGSSIRRSRRTRSRRRRRRPRRAWPSQSPVSASPSGIKPLVKMAPSKSAPAKPQSKSP